MKNFPFTSDMEFVAEVTASFCDDFDFEPAPDAGEFCGVLNTAFWASMQSEEGHPVRASLALIDPDLAAGVFRLSDPIALSSHAIAKLSASFPFRPGAIAVRFSPQGPPLIWGFLLPKPEYGCLIEILGPGYIVVRDEPGRLEVALLPDGSQIPFQGANLDDMWCDLFFQRTRHTLVGSIPSELSFQFYGFLRTLSRAMVDHHRGGSVLVVDPQDETWRNAVDFKYEFSKPAEYLFALTRELREWQQRWSTQDEKQKGQERAANELRFYPASKQQDELEQAIKLVGGLTAVDGAMVMTPDLKILGYGAKLKATAKKLKISEPRDAEGSSRDWRNPSPVRRAICVSMSGYNCPRSFARRTLHNILQR